MKMGDLQNYGISAARTRLEPLGETKLEAPGYNTYLRRIRGYSVPLMCYCVYRWDWLIRTLVKHGVDVAPFLPPSELIPPATCRKVEKVMRAVLESGRYEWGAEELVLQDIEFWGQAQGVKIHPWELL